MLVNTIISFSTIDVILANAGIQVCSQGIVAELTWIPAFVGMTMCVML